MRLLIIEDDVQISTALARGLRHAVDAFDRIASARDAVRSVSYDLVILDLGLPDGDGTDLLRSLRSHEDHVPVLVLTARDEVADRVRVLNPGADDDLVKPFELAELEARISAVTRRAIGRSGGDLRLDLSERRVHLRPLAV